MSSDWNRKGNSIYCSLWWWLHDVYTLRNSSDIHIFAYFYVDMLLINVKVYVKIMSIKIPISVKIWSVSNEVIHVTAQQLHISLN